MIEDHNDMNDVPQTCMVKENTFSTVWHCSAPASIEVSRLPLRVQKFKDHLRVHTVQYGGGALQLEQDSNNCLSWRVPCSAFDGCPASLSLLLSLLCGRLLLPQWKRPFRPSKTSSPRSRACHSSTNRT